MSCSLYFCPLLHHGCCITCAHRDIKREREWERFVSDRRGTWGHARYRERVREICIRHVLEERLEVTHDIEREWERFVSDMCWKRDTHDIILYITATCCTSTYMYTHIHILNALYTALHISHAKFYISVRKHNIRDMCQGSHCRELSLSY